MYFLREDATLAPFNRKIHVLNPKQVKKFHDTYNDLPIAIKHDVKYQKAQKKCNKANEKIRDLNLTPQQWDTVDAAITAENISSIEYIRIAYKQGIIDAFSILRETL